MQIISLGLSRFSPTAGMAATATASLLTFATLALLALVLAYWSWIWFAPSPEPRVEPATVSGSSISSAQSLFGKIQQNGNAASSAGSAIKLLGVVAAAADQRGYALIQLNAKQILVVHEGEELAPGIRLAEVYTDHVILQRNNSGAEAGTRETLTWPGKHAAVKAPAPQINR